MEIRENQDQGGGAGKIRRIEAVIPKYPKNSDTPDLGMSNQAERQLGYFVGKSRKIV